MLDTSTVDLLERLDRGIDEVLERLLVPGEPVALVNFPNQRNAGDPAIWLGEEHLLARLGVPVRYRAAAVSYDPHSLEARLPKGPILINGGGNLGDLYPGQQGTRERILADFPGRRVIQFPQSVWFEEPANEARMASLIREHGNFCLLVRERLSERIARQRLDIEPVICPDLALALGPMERPAPARSSVLWLARRDGESAGYDPPVADGVEVVDWLEPLPDEAAPSWRMKRVMARNGRLTDLLRDDPDAGRWPARRLSRTFDPMSRYWVRRGQAILARGQVVVTDRLHGHLLALAMGIPHVVLDNRTGKVSSHLETWSGDSPLVHPADGASDALEQALSLAGRSAKREA